MITAKNEEITRKRLNEKEKRKDWDRFRLRFRFTLRFRFRFILREEKVRVTIIGSMSQMHLLLISSKLMRLDRLPSKIRSKSYSNPLLIVFFDPNLPVLSIIATLRFRFDFGLKKFKFEPKLSILVIVFEINRLF